VQNPWIRKPPPGLETAAVYFTLKNLTKRAVFIVGVTSPLAAHAMIHETSTVEGQSRMRMRERVTVPGGSNVAFAPEGLHVMLSGLNKALEVGDKVPLTLQLDHGGSIDFVATVRPLDAK
jgi:copper(I)-binding protein